MLFELLVENNIMFTAIPATCGCIQPRPPKRFLSLHVL
jgi:hypothetical protein